jgi:hypothetical protein
MVVCGDCRRILEIIIVTQIPEAIDDYDDDEETFSFYGDVD